MGVDRAALEARWPGASVGGMGLVVEGDPGALIAAMETRFALGPRDIVDQRALKAISNRIFEQTFAVTAALNVLTLGVAGIALLTSLAMLADLRLPALAPLWAMGLTQRRLAAMEFARTVVLAALTALAAIPLGLALAWILVSVVNVQAFGWRLPFYLFPGQWATLGAIAVLLAAAAGALPAWRLSRMAPARLVKLFAEER